MFGRSASFWLSMICPVDAFSDSSSLSPQLAEIIELRSTHSALPDQFDPVDNTRVQRKYTLDTNSETGLPHRDRLANAGMLAGDHNSLKCLNAFLIAFFDFHVNANRVPGLKSRKITA